MARCAGLGTTRLGAWRDGRARVWAAGVARVEAGRASGGAPARVRVGAAAACRRSGAVRARRSRTSSARGCWRRRSVRWMSWGGRIRRSRISSRARGSRGGRSMRLFANREECLAAVLEDILGVIAGELAAAGLEGLAWRERVRRGLWAILAFFDREPVLARVCVVQAFSGGPGCWSAARRSSRGWRRWWTRAAASPRAARCTPLTAEGLVGAAFGIVYARLLKGQREPLTELLGELMGMIVLPYLGPAAARREQDAPGARAR